MCARVQICTRAGDQSVLLKYQISGLGVTRAFRERRKKLSERKRERQSVVAPHANFARGREKREKERAVLIMKKSSGSSFQNLQGTNTLRRLVKEWCRCVVLLQRRENTGIVLPRQTITFSTNGGSSFSSSSSSSCAKRCFVPVFSRSRANSANDDDSPF